VRLGRMCCSGITAPPCDADWQWLNRRERLAQSVMAWVQVYERLGGRGELHRPGTKIVLLVPQRDPVAEHLAAGAVGHPSSCRAAALPAQPEAGHVRTGERRNRCHTE
jgi:hypothetical protein